eukprot:4217797-Amphidinium_carterae.1
MSEWYVSVADKGIKRTLCKFWQQGSCDRGAACGFAHGDEEIGMPITLSVEEDQRFIMNPYPKQSSW